MSPVAKALWYIETRLAHDVTLDDLAAAGGVSRFHMTRAFSAATGLSIMRYVRGRRLTEAARKLAAGARDILAVALDAGYGSHEAFTRAFRDQFGLTPEALRARQTLDPIDLVEPLLMTTPGINLAPPRFERAEPLLLAGLAERHTYESSTSGIPGQWQRFTQQPGTAQRVGDDHYGVTWNLDEDGRFDYLCAVRVADFAQLPAGWTPLRVAAQRYVVFSHTQHIAAIRQTWQAIWNDWLPASGHQALDAPTFERYGPGFDGRTGMGGLEIWVPISG